MMRSTVCASQSGQLITVVGGPGLIAGSPLPGTLLSCSICSPKTTVDVSPELAWLLVLHAHVDHGIPMEILERMYLGMSPSSVMASIFVSICGKR